jgi:type I restriction enzyme S subunit
LYYLFEGGQLFKGLGKLGTQLNLNTETIGSIHIPIPPDDEIEMIVDFLDYETAKIDKLVAAIKDSITLLKERRSALITAAVTGQIALEDMTS